MVKFTTDMNWNVGLHCVSFIHEDTRQHMEADNNNNNDNVQENMMFYDGDTTSGRDKSWLLIVDIEGEARVVNQELLSLISGDIGVLVAGAVHGDNTIGDIAVLDGGAFILWVELMVIWSFRGSEA